MRHHGVRRVFVGLILAFPLLLSVVAASPNQGVLSGAVQAGLPVVAVELVLVGGLLFVRRERRRLLVELDAARTAMSPGRTVVSRPSPALVKAQGATWRPVSGSPGV